MVEFSLGNTFPERRPLSWLKHNFSALKDRLRCAGLSISGLMDVLLCDNGGEFSDVFSFENDRKGNPEISLFFCDPTHSSQKPFIEKNHTLFRDIVPKGSSFDDFSQDTVNLIFSHVNSVSRSLYGGKTPYEVLSFCQTYSQTISDIKSYESFHCRTYFGNLLNTISFHVEPGVSPPCFLPTHHFSL